MRLLRVVALAALTLTASAVRAQPGGEAAARTEEARAAFERGVAAYEAGSFEEALVSFQRAYALTESADILYNVGTVADRLRRDDLALEAYESYLRGRPDAEDRANVEARIAAIRAARAAGTGTAAAGGDASVAPEAAASGPDEGAVAVAIGLEERAGAGGAGDAGRTDGPRPPAGSDTGAWVLVASGAVGLAAGIALLVAVAVDLATAASATTWAALSGPHERVPVMSAIGWPLLGVGTALLGAGIGWAVASGGATSSRTPDAPTARAVIGLRVAGAGLTLEGAF